MATREGSVVSIEVDNGVLVATVLGFEPMRFDPDEEMPVEANKYACLHGYKQAWGDAAAQSKGATAQEKYDAMRAKLQRWQDTGEFKSAGGTGEVGDGLLVQAIMEFQSVDKTEARRLVGLMDRKLQAAMRASSELSPIIEKIKANRVKSAAPNFSAGDALKALMLRPIGGVQH